MKNYFFICVFSFILSFQVKGEKVLGGEITWECLTAGSVPAPAPADIGKFIFTLTVYTECENLLYNMQPIRVFNNPNLLQIVVYEYANLAEDISYTCNPVLPGDTISNCISGQGPGRIKKVVYKSLPVMLYAPIWPAGWTFTWSWCCRDTSMDNIDLTGYQGGITVLSRMYAGIDTNICFDSSPKFLEHPVSVACVGSPFKYNHHAIDGELDSLRFEFAEATPQFFGLYFPPTNPPPQIYETGYDYLHPLPDTGENVSNAGATIDPYTGEITFTSFTEGEFVTNVRVTAYSCGVKLSEVIREIRVRIDSCPPIFDSTTVFNNIPAAVAPLHDTVVAGDIICYNYYANDTDLLPDSSQQTLTLGASGLNFAPDFVSTSNCLFPPCATLSPPPGDTAVTNVLNTVSTFFCWTTSCNHVAYNPACYNEGSLHTFVFKTFDDFCPVPGIDISTFGIYVKDLPIIPAPSLRCISVLSNGDVVLNWIPATDSLGSFKKYRIYTATNISGPFTAIDSIFNVNADNYTHLGANAHSQIKYYFVQTVSACYGEVRNSALLSTIHLDVTPVPPGNVAILTWNALSTPLLQTTQLPYNIYREYPAGTGLWAPINSSTLLTETDTVFICPTMVNYQIEILDASGCASTSTVDGAIIGDTVIPQAPIIDTVSVDATGSSLIAWNPSPNADVTQYEVYRLDQLSGGWQSIGLTATTSFLDNSLLANSSTQYYTVTAVDSCMNTSFKPISHQTVFLSYYLDFCKGEVRLKWNRYRGFNGGVVAYNVYLKEGANPFTLYISNGPNDTTLILDNLTQMSNYVCYVQAVGATQSSTSNVISFIADVANQPDFLYLRAASVTPANLVNITCYVDSTGDVREYKILRMNTDGTFQLVGTVGKPTGSFFSYTDQTAKPHLRSETYKVTALDSCNVESISSNLSKTIYLSSETSTNIVRNDILWSGYEIWLGGVDYYNVFRIIPPATDAELLSTIQSGNAYGDDISLFQEGTGEFCYYVEAVEGSGNPYFFVDTAYSNIACIIQEPTLFVPNAYKSGGLSNSFKPISAFVNNEGYDFKIFNRWGQVLFETGNVTEGWDATYSGEKVPEGVYVYYVRYKSFEGNNFEKTGTVTVLH